MNRTRRAAVTLALVTAVTAGGGATGVAGASSLPGPDCGQCASATAGSAYGAGTQGWRQRSGAGEGSQGARGRGRGLGAGAGSGQGYGTERRAGAGEHADLPDVVEGATLTRKIRTQLKYLVEEEKLAGDIYDLAESLYGDRVFANISRAEDNHADQVRLLLDRYDVKDPSATREAGEFRDKDLQRLYDRLAARVSKSREKAVKAAILIEKTDIADLKTLLRNDLPADAEQVAENLLAGSQRHLVAFRRQA